VPPVSTRPTVVVTGGAGCLGHAVIEQLLEPGGAIDAGLVRSFDRRASGRGARERLVEIEGDLRSREALRGAVRGADLVLHCAATVDWGQNAAAVLDAINHEGTKNVVAACRAEGVRALVHTSTLDVLFTGRPMVDVDETHPYPERHPNAYCRTKADGERRALEANGADLAVAVVRPCVVFGERDPFHVPALLERARKRRLFYIGDGKARAEFSYVGNVAHLLLVAGRSLLSPARAAAGRVYFATDGGPGNFFDFLAPFVEAGGGVLPPSFLRIPAPPLRLVGALLEDVAAAARPMIDLRPTLTRFAVDFVCSDYTIKTDRAARELGYAPRFSRAEAIARTVGWNRARKA
jgi:2-alkyl-3-oxoalkanoate reductase